MQWGVGPLIADRVELSRRGTFEAKTTVQRDAEHEMSGKARRNKERLRKEIPREIRKEKGNAMNEPSLLESAAVRGRSGRRSKGGPAF